MCWSLDVLEGHSFLQTHATKKTDTITLFLLWQVEANDADEGVNSEVEYHLYEANSSEALTLFTIDPSTGHITLARSAKGLGEALVTSLCH